MEQAGLSEELKEEIEDLEERKENWMIAKFDGR